MKRKITAILLSFTLTIILVGCSKNAENNSVNNPLTDSNTTVPSGESYSQISLQTSENITDNNITDDTNVSITDFDLTISNRDQDASYTEETSCKIAFSGLGIDITGEGAMATAAAVNNSVVTITKEGTYILSGTSSDAQIIVEAEKTDKVQLVLNNVNLASKTSAPIIIKQCDKVFITLAPNSNNTLSDTPSYETVINETTVDSVIFSKDDLTINGSGTLIIQANYKHGIVSKDDLVITGGTIEVTSQKVGLEANDAIKLTEGTLHIISGGDGIRVTNVEDATLGFVYIDGTNLDITSQTDAIQAESLLFVKDGNLKITTGGGSINAPVKTEAGPGGFGFWGQNQTMTTEAANQASTEETTASAKALKCTKDIYITGGTVVIDSYDDAVHSNDSVYIQGGNIQVTSGDDGIHADLTLTIDNGNIDISKSYEGLEAGEITINGGTIHVVSSDDGLNAAGGNDNSSTNGRMGQNPFDSDSSKHIYITGGYLMVDASGDGIDSNGTITMSGGTVLVNGPSDNGNAALDYGTSADISGGIFLALGSSGMAQTFADTSTQGSIMTSISSQANGTSIALCDNHGNVLASLTATKQFDNIVVSTPDITDNGTYTIRTGTISDTDQNGFTTSGSISNSTELSSITMTSLHYGTSTGFGGGFGGGFRGGDKGENKGPGGGRGQKPAQ